jgi:hypothetical protein
VKRAAPCATFVLYLMGLCGGAYVNARCPMLDVPFGQLSVLSIEH